MAATDFQNGRIPLGIQDFPVINTSASTLSVGMVVKLDTANLLSATQGGVGVTVCTAVTDIVMGVVITKMLAGAQGTIQVTGAAWCIAAGAITAGVIVGASGATNGDVTAYTATDAYLGQALTAAVNAADPVLVMIRPGTTA